MEPIKLGDHISYEKDGVIYTERVDSVRYSSGFPAVYRRLNRWQRFIRMLTPPRLRRSLLVRPAQLPVMTINGGAGLLTGKTLAQLEAIKGAFERITDPPTC
jgi:hypothetical protein